MVGIKKYYYLPFFSFVIYFVSLVKIIFDDSQFNYHFESTSNILWVGYAVIIPLLYFIYSKMNCPFIGKIILGLGVLILAYLSWLGITIATFCEEFIDEHKYKSRYVQSLYISTTYFDCGAIGSPSFVHKNYYNLRSIEGINILMKIEQKTLNPNYFDKIKLYE